MELYACKNYFRESKELQRAIVSASQTLYDRIRSYEKQNVEFSRIYNDDKVKYDKHGDFYTYKTQKQNMQIRILYAYVLIDAVAVIIIADFAVKKKNNKDYIKRFDAMNNTNPMDVYANSKCVYSR